LYIDTKVGLALGVEILTSIAFELYLVLDAELDAEQIPPSILVIIPNAMQCSLQHAVICKPTISYNPTP
jgi:hypothetical protein